jgi:hypothetical protein
LGQQTLQRWRKWYWWWFFNHSSPTWYPFAQVGSSHRRGKEYHNHRTIDGKVHFFHNKKKRWVPVNDQQTSPGSTGGPPTTLASPAVPPTTGTPVTPVASNQTRDIAVANAARQLELTFQGLLNQFSTGS